MRFIISEQLDAVVQGFDKPESPLELSEVVSAIAVHRTEMKGSATPEQDFGAWCEMAPLHVGTSFENGGENPWNSFFRPKMSFAHENGTAVFLPEIDQVPLEALEHWSQRAQRLGHPVLRARYADAVWDLGPFITKSMKKDVTMARIAIDAYIDAVNRRLDRHPYVAFTSAQRAVDLAAQINDPARIDLARQALLDLHRSTMASGTGHEWARAFDHLVDHKKAKTTDAEMESLAADLETVLARVSDPSNPATFDPHAAKEATNRLARFYIGKGKPDEVRRVHGISARAFEAIASKGDATLAASFLQDSMDAYAQAGQADQVERVRVAMQQKIRESHDEMAQFGIPWEMTEDQMQEWIGRLVVDSPSQTLANIAMAFLPDPAQVAEEVQRLAKDAPLMSMLTQQIVGDDRVAARIGSVEDDLPGRVLQHTVRVFQINVRVIHAVIHAAIERHKLMPSDFVSWANRKGVIDAGKLPLLFAGVQAWFCRDYFKTVHVIIPQVEAALRKMVDVVGKPTTKPAGTVPGISVSINMSDILFNPATIAALGPMAERLALYMKAIYADPRGMNLRNEFAHGLLDATEVNEAAAIWLIHSLCVIGLWQKPDA